MFENPEQAFGGTRPMLGLIETIYASVQRPELWDEVLRQVSKAVNGESIALYAGAPDERSLGLVSVQNVDPTEWSRFSGYYAAINPMYPACVRKFRPNETWYSDQALPDAEFVKTEFYNDFYKPNDMHYSLGLLLDVDGTPASLSCQRPLTWGPFPDATEVICTTLRPHLQRALSLHHEMGRLDATKLGLEAALDAHEHAVIGVDAEGRIVFSNERAEHLAQKGDGVRLANGKVHCVNLRTDLQLQTLLTQAIATGQGLAPTFSTNSSLLIERGDGKAPLVLTATPFHASIAGRSTRLAALVFLTDLALTQRSRAAALRSVYALTPTEGRVADLLMQGLDVSEAGEQLHITFETARFHTKRILAKTGKRKQSELMRLMLSLPAI